MCFFVVSGNLYVFVVVISRGFDYYWIVNFVGNFDCFICVFNQVYVVWNGGYIGVLCDFF